MQLSGAQRLKLAYTSRLNPKDPTSHQILSVDSFSYETLSSIIQFRAKDQWQVVKYFIDQIIGEKDGRYMFVKAAFKPSVRTYLLPKDAEVQNDEENEDEEEGKIEL